MDSRPNVKPKILKLLEENMGTTLHNIGVGKDCLNRVSFVQKMRPAIDKWDSLILKSFCISKEVTEWRGSPQNGWEYIWQRINIQTIPRTQKTNSFKWLIQKWATNLNRKFSKEDIKMVKNYLKNIQLS